MFQQMKQKNIMQSGEHIFKKGDCLNPFWGKTMPNLKACFGKQLYIVKMDDALVDD